MNISNIKLMASLIIFNILLLTYNTYMINACPYKAAKICLTVSIIFGIIAIIFASLSIFQTLKGKYLNEKSKN